MGDHKFPVMVRPLYNPMSTLRRNVTDLTDPHGYTNPDRIVRLHITHNVLRSTGQMPHEKRKKTFVDLGNLHAAWLRIRFGRDFKGHQALFANNSLRTKALSADLYTTSFPLVSIVRLSERIIFLLARGVLVL